ncbi:kinase-like protein [Hypoxylon rubiginosum]|uniref:Kinase-like protein n=1 Tax=Hypoxylon rubiginosum TaxID=110542 RepID=A0ACC0DJ84_9PEZI|nr:kinase-like protein [Hypoxylon rubiginosum]
MARPIAQISCWITPNPSEDTEGLKLPVGFHVNNSSHGNAGRHNSQTSVDVPLFPGRSVAVGRNHHENEISINHPNISRQHFLIYSVVYDLQAVQTQPPMVYVRDRQSLGGTYVDGHCIGEKAKGASRGFYLSKDVEISIRPYWKFRVSFLSYNELKTPLNAIQLRESSLFGHRYMITERRLGIGSFASVHLAVDVKTGLQLACKIHDLDRLQKVRNSKEIIQRIMNETDILGKLRHPNLPTFEYAFRSKHTLYTFTELATGGDLFSMRLVRGVFTEKDCKFVIQQVVNALRYLHKGGIAHRDLKPDNILFAAGPEVMSRVILSDLGEIENGRTHDLTVDLWSLGIIVLFLLTPYDYDWPREWSQAAIDQWLDNIFENLSHQKISEQGQQFIRDCLMFEPSLRIDAFRAKCHLWFQQLPDKDQFKFRIQEQIKAWKPTHLITPPVQELPDLRYTSRNTMQAMQEDATYDAAAADKLGKRNVEADSDTDYSEASPYFTEPKSPPSKRLRTSASGDGNPQTDQRIKQMAGTMELRKPNL